MAIGGAVSRSLPLFNWRSSSSEVKKSGHRLALPGFISGNGVEAIRYDRALDKIKVLKGKLIRCVMELSEADRLRGSYFWLNLYTIAICAQEEMIRSVNDGFIASDVPWDASADVPLISSTIGDAISYAERLKNPEDHFLKALLLSFSGWTLLSTDQRKCACRTGRLEDLTVDVLVQTDITILRSDRGLDRPCLKFYVGVQSDSQEHLEHHYSFREKSTKYDGLIIIHCSGGYFMKESHDSKNTVIKSYDIFKQAEEFWAGKTAKLMYGLINSFDKAV